MRWKNKISSWFTDCMASLADLHTTLQPAGEELYQFLLSKQEALSK